MAVAELFTAGLLLRPQDVEALRQCTGEAGSDTARALALLEVDPDACEASPLLALVYSPGQEAMRTVEPALADANLDAAGALALEHAANLLVLAQTSHAVLPDGRRTRLHPRAGKRATFK